MLFPKWTNKVPLLLAALAGGAGVTAVGVVWYFFSPEFTDVGYQPKQPVPYSHKLHVGELGMDCRYCHFNVERSSAAGVPPTQVCMNCHKIIKNDSPNIIPLRESAANNTPMNWVKVHNLPDYAYFDHSRHINVGVSCVVCHGRIDKMEEVHQVKPLSMGWCLDCHRAPDKNLRPAEFITQLDWETSDPLAVGKKIREEKNVTTKQDCNTCHR